MALLLLTAGVQRAAGGDWNSYSGQRLGFYARTGYPAVDFPASAWNQKLRQWGNTSWTQEGAFEPSSSLRLWGWNLVYFLVGRDVGVLPYFLPLLLGVLAFRRDRGRCRSWPSSSTAAPPPTSPPAAASCVPACCGPTARRSSRCRCAGRAPCTRCGGLARTTTCTSSTCGCRAPGRGR